MQRRSARASPVTTSRSLVHVRSLVLLCSLAKLTHAARPPPSVLHDAPFAVPYFAFGANLDAKTLRKRRRIVPLATYRAVAPQHRLAFSLQGFSEAEPAFASLEPDAASECHGLVHTLRPADWLRLCASEGVPFAYTAVPVRLERYDGVALHAWSLRATRPPSPSAAPLRPSARYLGLIREGARRSNLDERWLAFLDEIEAAPGSAGSSEPARDYERRVGATFV
jgi:hypothetical protein